MKDLTLYIRKDTAISRLDPRAKLVATVALFALAMTFNHPLYVLGLLLLEAILIGASGASVNVRRFKTLLLLLLVFSAILWSLFLREGSVWLRLGPVTLYRESSLFALAMGMRLVAMVLAGLIFLSSTMVEEFVFALRKSGLPLPVAFAFSLAFRMVSQVFRTVGMVKQAQQIRGLDLDAGGIVRRIKNHIPLLIPIFIFSIKSAESLTRALEARGFRCTRKPTPFIIRKVTLLDYAVMALSVIAASAAIILRIKGFGEVLPRL
jgi:energy-coupling factor transport system permease protein